VPPIVKVPTMRFKIPIKWDPTIIMYLVIIDKIAKAKGELLKGKASARFFNMVQTQVKAYVQEGKQPPAAIASAIMNIADDVMAKRDVVVRAGDYIALMDYAMKQGTV